MTRRAFLVLAAVLAWRSAGAAPTADDMALWNRSTLELTTIGRKTGRSHTATVWFVYEDGPPRLYVQSGKGGQTDWYLNLLKTPAVTLMVGDRQFRGRGAALEDDAESARVHALFVRKYFVARVMSWFGGGFGGGKVVRIDDLEPSA